MQEFLEKPKQELRLRNYSLKTIKTYLRCLGEYFDFKKFNLEEIDEEKMAIVDSLRNNSDWISKVNCGRRAIFTLGLRPRLFFARAIFSPYGRVLTFFQFLMEEYLDLGYIHQVGVLYSQSQYNLYIHSYHYWSMKIEILFQYSWL